MKYEMVVDIRAKIAFDVGDSKIYEEWSPEQRAERIKAITAETSEEIRREFGMADDDPLEITIDVREVADDTEVSE